MITDKVRSHHLERKALLYVRQSSPHQVLHNRESSALQYAMQDRLTALGWSEIEVIDEDLGRSAAGGRRGSGRKSRSCLARPLARRPMMSSRRLARERRVRDTDRRRAS